MNPVVKTNLPCYTSHRRSTTVTVSLETFPSPPDMAMVLNQVATWKFLFYGKSTGFIFSSLL